MANEFVARNGLIAQDSSTISGSLIVTNGVTGSLLGTSSYANNADTLDGLDSSVFTSTSSFQNYTSSASAGLTALNAQTASLLNYTSSNSMNVAALFAASASLNASVAGLNTQTSSLNASVASLNAQTSSLLNYTSSNAMNVATLFAASASLNANVAGLNLQTASLLSYTSSNNTTVSTQNTRLGALEAATSSIYNTTSSLNASVVSLNSYTSSTDAKIASIYSTTSSLNTRVGTLETYTSSLNNRTSSFATTGSNTFNGTQTITGSILQSGNFTSTGTITAQTLVVQTITSSIDFVTGSTRFGTLTSNTHQFTGSVSVSGSLDINGVSSTSRIIPNGTTYKTSNFLDFYPTNDNVLFFHAGTSWGDPVIAVNGTTTGSVLTNSLAQQLVIRGDGAGGIGFSNGSSINMIISGGNVGVGTTTPDVRLDVLGTSDTTDVVRIRKSSTGSRRGALGTQSGVGYLDLYNDSSALSIRLLAAGDSYFNSGNVGIGTTSPAHILHIRKDQNAYTWARIENQADNSSAYTGLQLGAYGNSWGLAIGSSLANSNSLNFLIDAGGTNVSRMTILAGGNTGIGTTSPENTLHVYKGSAGTVTANSNSPLVVENNGSSYINILVPDANESGILFGRPTSNVDGGIVYNSNLARGLEFRTAGNSYRMGITSAGNVGIGTTSPDNILTVKAENGLVDVQSTGDGQTIGFLARYLNSATLGGGFKYTTGDAQLYIDNYYSGNNGVYSDINIRNCIADGGITTRIKIKGSSGNVGIGTTNPTALLHVSGTTGGVFEVDGASAVTALYVSASGQIGINTITPRTRTEFSSGLPTSIPTRTNRTSGIAVTDGGAIYGRIGVADLSAGGVGYPTYIQAGDWDGASYYNILLNPLGGRVSVGTTSPGYLFQVNGPSGDWSGYFKGSSSSGNSYGLFIDAGTTSADSPFMVRSADGGTTFLRILGNGNVGIGTTSPAYKLDINGTGNFTGVLRISGTSSSRISLESNYSGGNVGIALFNTSGTENIWLNAANGSINGLGPAYFGGSVGVGTINPSQKLDVQGNIYANGDIRSQGIFRDYQGEALLQTNTSAVTLIGSSGASTSRSLAFLAGNTERMCITTGGNVGIGTTSPVARLDLGSTTNGNRLTWANYSNIFSEYSSGDLWLSSNFYGNLGSSGYVTSNTATFGAAGIVVSGTGASLNGVIKFFVDDAASKTAGAAFTPTERMRIVGNGNVGIGTTSPIGKQHNVITSNGTALFLNNSTGGGGAFVDLDFTTYTTAQSGYANASATIRVIDDGNFSGHITFRTKGGSIGASQTERARIEASTGHILPGANGTQNLGSDSLRWATVFTSDLDMSNGIGDYTIVEGEEDLFLYNNKTNKVFKFVIQEVDPSEATPKMKR